MANFGMRKKGSKNLAFNRRRNQKNLRSVFLLVTVMFQSLQVHKGLATSFQRHTYIGRKKDTIFDTVIWHRITSLPGQNYIDSSS